MYICTYQINILYILSWHNVICQIYSINKETHRALDFPQMELLISERTAHWRAHPAPLASPSFPCSDTWPSECIWTQTTKIKNKTKQGAFSKNLSCVLSAGCKATLRFSTVLSTDRRPERRRPSSPFQILSQTTCWVTLISGQTAIPRNDAIFSVHKDIVPNVLVFSPPAAYTTVSYY